MKSKIIKRINRKCNILFLVILWLLFSNIIMNLLAEASDFRVTTISTPSRITVGYFKNGKFIEARPMDFEEYLKGVVPFEMSSEYRLKALEAQAVAARCYAVTNLNDKHRGSGYNVCSKTCCQRWEPPEYFRNGVYPSSTSRAVRDTVGIGLKYKTSIVNCNYFDHCNGFTKNSEDVEDLIKPGKTWSYTLYWRKTPCLCSYTRFHGHGAGMCQEGANAMAASINITYSDILLHYYHTSPPFVKEVKISQERETIYHRQWKDNLVDHIHYSRNPEMVSENKIASKDNNIIFEITYSEKMYDEPDFPLELYLSNNRGAIDRMKDTKVTLHRDPTGKLENRKATGTLSSNVIAEKKLEGPMYLKFKGRHLYTTTWELDKNPSTITFDGTEGDTAYERGTDTNHCFYIHSAPNRVVLAIDCSGSMQGNKLQQAKNSAKEVIDWLRVGDKAGIVIFSDYAIRRSDLVEITDSNIKTNLKNTIDSIQVGNLTNITDGLTVSYNIFNQHQPFTPDDFIVLLTNGQHNVGAPLNGDSPVVQLIKNAGIKIMGVGIGIDANVGLLDTLARATGNIPVFYTNDPLRLQGLYFYGIETFIGEGGMIREAWWEYNPNRAKNGKNGLTTEIDTIPIDAYTNEATFVVSWATADGSSSRINFSLVDPDGATVNVNNAEEVYQGSSYTIFRILAPKQGAWSAVTEPAPGIPRTYYTVQAFADSPSLKVQAYPERTKYGICESVILHAEAKLNGAPITGANVTGNIKKPDGSYFDPVTLYDDGSSEHGDETAGDGIYSYKLINGFSTEGTYTFECTVENAEFRREAKATAIVRRVNIRTAASITGEQFKDSEDRDFIKSGTAITLSVAYSDTAVAYTEYAIDQQRNFNVGTSFNLAGYSDGMHTIYYRSVDVNGHAEALKNKKVYLDSSCPMSSIKQITPLLTIDSVNDLTSYNAILNNVNVVNSMGNGEVVLSPSSPPYVTSGSIQHVFQVTNTTTVPVLKTDDSIKLQIDTLTPTSVYGAPLFVSGKVRQAIYTRVGITNILTANQSSVETDLNGFGLHGGPSQGQQISRETYDSYDGNACIKCVTDGSGQWQGYQVGEIPVTPGGTYTFSVYLKLESFATGACGIVLQMRDGTVTPIADKFISISELSTTEWRKFDITATFAQTRASVLISIANSNPPNVGIAWLADAMQFEELPYSTDWILGGTTRAGEMLRYENFKKNKDEGSASFWFKLKGKGGETCNWGRTALVLKNNIDGNWINSIHIGYDGSGELRTFGVGIFDSAGGLKRAKNPDWYPVLTERWYHYTATWKNGELKVYFNGEHLGDGYDNGTGILSRAPNILGVGGVEMPSTTLFNGYIDDLRIYDVALSDTEVQRIYQRKMPALSNETVLAAGFDGNSLDGQTTTEAATRIKYEVAGGNSQEEAESATLQKVMVSVSDMGSGFGLLNKVGSYPWYRVNTTLTTEDSNQTPIVNRLTVGNLETIKPLSSYPLYLDVAFETQDSNEVSSDPKSFSSQVNNGELREYCFAYSPVITLNYGDAVQYYSKDNLNNTELVNRYAYYNDSTPPSTAITIEGPKYENYVKSSSRFILNANDDASGVQRSEYSIDILGSWTQYQVGGFSISSEGAHNVYYRSIDRMGNIEETKQVSVIVDNNSPVTNLFKVNRKEVTTQSDWQAGEQSTNTDLNSSLGDVLINTVSGGDIITWTKKTQMNVLPSVDGWLFDRETELEERVSSIKDGVLTISTVRQEDMFNCFAYSYPLQLDNNVGWTVEFGAKIDRIDLLPGGERDIYFVCVNDNRSYVYVYITPSEVALFFPDCFYHWVPVPLDTSVFHKYRLTGQGHELKLYVDGQLVVDLSNVWDDNPGVPSVFFGKCQPRNFKCQLDYMNIYSGGAVPSSPVIYNNQATQVNTLDFGSIPIGIGKFSGLDVVYPSTSISYSIAYSDNGTVYSAFQQVVNGATVENHRFAKVKAILNSDPNHNLSPVLREMGVDYILPNSVYDNTVYINQTYKLALETSDPQAGNSSGSGIGDTFYKIDNNNLKLYDGQLLAMPDNGRHYFYFYSFDNLQTQENTHIVSVMQDIIAPSSAIVVSNPKYGNNPVIFSSVTEFTLSAVDLIDGTTVSSGIERIEYKIDNGSWTEYFFPFTIQSENPRFIYYRSIDRAGNAESDKSLRISLDAYAPESGVIFPRNASYHRTETPLREMKGYARDNFEVDNVRIYIKRISDSMYWDGFRWNPELTWLKTSFIPAIPDTGPTPLIPQSPEPSIKRQNLYYWSYKNLTSINMWTSGESYLVQSISQDKVQNIEVTERENYFVFDSTPPIMPLTCLTAPNGGENLTGGEVFEITWNNTAISDNYGLRDNPIALYYTPNAGQTWILIDNEQQNDGSYSWTVPNINSTQVKVKLTAFDLAGNSASDESNNYFTITSNLVKSGKGKNPGLGKGLDLAKNMSAEKSLFNKGGNAMKSAEAKKMDNLAKNEGSKKNTVITSKEIKDNKLKNNNPFEFNFAKLFKQDNKQDIFKEIGWKKLPFETKDNSSPNSNLKDTKLELKENLLDKLVQGKKQDDKKESLVIKGQFKEFNEITNLVKVIDKNKPNNGIDIKKDILISKFNNSILNEVKPNIVYKHTEVKDLNTGKVVWSSNAGVGVNNGVFTLCDNNKNINDTVKPGIQNQDINAGTVNSVSIVEEKNKPIETKEKIAQPTAVVNISTGSKEVITTTVLNPVVTSPVVSGTSITIDNKNTVTSQPAGGTNPVIIPGNTGGGKTNSGKK